MKTPDIRTRLGTLGLTLPPAPKPIASYVPTARSGAELIVSGQIPVVDGSPIATGTVPDQVAEDTAVECARVCTLNAIAAAVGAIGEDGSIEAVLRLGCFVACGPGYANQPLIANGASELLFEVFGEPGRHARAAVGCSSLPLNVPVEIEFLFRVG